MVCYALVGCDALCFAMLFSKSFHAFVSSSLNRRSRALTVTPAVENNLVKFYDMKRIAQGLRPQESFETP